MDNLFSGCYLCDDLTRFLAFWKENPGFDFLIVATTAGELIDRRGLIYGGRKASKTGASPTGFFQREAEIRRLRETVSRENEQLTALNMAAMEIQARMDECESEIESRRRRSGELEQELSALGAEERAARVAAANLEEQAARRRSELDELEGSQGAAVERMERARTGLLEKEAEIEARRAAIAGLEHQIDSLRSGTDEKRDAVNEVRFELAEKRQKLHLIDSALAEVRRALDEDAQIGATGPWRKPPRCQRAGRRVRRAGGNQSRPGRRVGRDYRRRRFGHRSRTGAHFPKPNPTSSRSTARWATTRLALRDNETRLQGFEVKLAEESSQWPGSSPTKCSRIIRPMSRCWIGGGSSGIPTRSSKPR